MKRNKQRKQNENNHYPLPPPAFIKDFTVCSGWSHHAFECLKMALVPHCPQAPECSSQIYDIENPRGARFFKI